MKLWLDDVRTPPYGEGFVWVTNVKDAKSVFLCDTITEMSLDHDLGATESGYDFLCWVEEMVCEGKADWPKKIYIHSKNPVGVQRMRQILDKYGV